MNDFTINIIPALYIFTCMKCARANILDISMQIRILRSCTHNQFFIRKWKPFGSCLLLQGNYRQLNLQLKKIYDKFERWTSGISILHWNRRKTDCCSVLKWRKMFVVVIAKIQFESITDLPSNVFPIYISFIPQRGRCISSRVFLSTIPDTFIPTKLWNFLKKGTEILTNDT